jgi:hypothetical protein
MPQRYNGIVVRAEPGHSYSVKRLDDGAVATLSGREACQTNYRLQIGDKVASSVSQSGGSCAHSTHGCSA